MRKLEIAFIIIGLIGFALNINLLAGGSFLLSIFLLCLSGLYFVFSFALLNKIPFSKVFKKVSYSGISAFRIVTAVFFGFGLALNVIAVLFGLEDLPAAEYLLMLALVQTVVLCILLFVVVLADRSNFYKTVGIRLLIWGGLCLLLFKLPYSKIIEYKFRAYPDYIEARRALRAAPQDVELQLRERAAFRKITQHQN